MLALVAAAALALSAALVGAVVVGERTTRMASPPPETGISPNSDADNAAWSQDGHAARLMAFDSGASNIVNGDANGKRDVFLLRRGTADGDLGGSIQRVSVAGRSGEADGDSTMPSISGDVRRRPNCVVFQSTATNLARGDRSPDSDVFLRDLRRRRTTLVSVGRTDATDGVVDGECEFVTFASGDRVYVRDLVERTSTRIATGTRPDQTTNGKGVAYERGGQVYFQAFERKFRSRRRGGPYVRRRGREVLVSRNASGERGNGTSGNASTDDNGYYVAFESTATNLCEGDNGCTGVRQDRNGATSDIFRRTLSSRAPTRDFMQMVSYSAGCTRADPGARTVDEQGNGASNNPAMTGAGENVLFDSEATNLRESAGIQIADGNGPVRDIYYWNFPRERPCGNVSRESRSDAPRERGQVYDGPSYKPAASGRANYIAFTSAQTGESGDTNGQIPDVFARFLGASDEQ